jgi:hypothetical protein
MYCVFDLHPGIQKDTAGASGVESSGCSNLLLCMNPPCMVCILGSVMSGLSVKGTNSALDFVKRGATRHTSADDASCYVEARVCTVPRWPGACHTWGTFQTHGQALACAKETVRSVHSSET